MTVSVRQDLETCFHDAGYVALIFVKEDGDTFYEVAWRDGGLAGRDRHATLDWAKEEYLKHVRSVGSMA